MSERVIRVAWREVTDYQADFTVDEDAAKAALSDGGHGYLEGFMAQHIAAMDPRDHDRAEVPDSARNEIVKVEVQP